MDPKIIDNTFDTEDNGTTTCIEGNPHDVDNVATNFSLKARKCRKVAFFSSKVDQFPSKFDTVIPTIPLRMYCGLHPNKNK